MTQDQLRAAHHLIEQGRVGDARHILQTMDDPTAKLWLAQLTAAKRQRKGQIALPLPLLVALALVIGVAALIVMLLLTPTLLTRIQDRAGNTAAEPAAEEALYAALVHYCTMTTGYGGEEPCMGWVDLVIEQNRAAAQACIAASGVETPEARAQVGACLTSSGVLSPL